MGNPGGATRDVSSRNILVEEKGIAYKRLGIEGWDFRKFPSVMIFDGLCDGGGIYKK